jgi:hypothetical protein
MDRAHDKIHGLRRPVRFDRRSAEETGERTLNVTSDESDAVMSRYPPAEISPGEFEQFVAELFDSLSGEVEDLRLALHDRIEGVDGTFEFDATIRYRWRGLQFLVILEAKRHKGTIKRELVQILHHKVLSVGAHKGVMFSTSRFQRGALEFAKTHGVALVSVTEGRFTYETRAAGPTPILTREEAARHFGLPTFVGHAYTAGDSSTSIRITLISRERPEYVEEILLPHPGGRPR